MSDGLPRVSVIIAAYHSADLLPRCLDSLATQVFGDFETIVVNSSPEARTAEVVSRYPWIRFHQHPERLFPHAARNVGVSMACGALLVFTDADCRAEPDWLAALVACHAAGHELIGGSIETSAAADISRAVHLLKYAPYLRGRPAGPLELAATGNMLVSRSVWERAGPFDGSLFSGDSLFSMRARSAGIVPWFEPRAVVIDQDEGLPRGFFRERFRRGREFGAIRAGFDRWTRSRLLLRIVLAPLAVLSALAGAAATCRTAGRLRAFAASLPFQAAARCAWCLGEACGYAAILLRGPPAVARPRVGHRPAGDASNAGLSSAPPRRTPADPMADLLASVVIPTRNRPQSVRACLDALAAQTMPPGSFEVIVVDDGGEPPLAVDPTASAGIFPLTVMRQEHAGPGTARNRGVDHARGEVVVFTDDDCLPTPSWLEKMVTAVRREPRGLVGGATLNGLPRSLCAETSHLILEIVYEHCNRDGSGSSFFASNNMACSRAAYLGIGGFDEAFRVASEDRDLCDRWRSHGEPLRWQRDAFVEHRHPQNFREFTRLHFRYGRGAYRYHRERRARGGGMSSRDVSMHARLPGYVWSRRRRWSLGRGLAIGAMMAWWEIVNAAGFAWEGLARAWTRPCTAPASCGTGRPEGRQASTSRIGSTCSTPTSFWSRPPKK